MCKDCFDKEYLSFPSQKDFSDFDIELSKKLSKGKLKFVRIDKDNLEFSYHIYHCDNCDTTWWLNDPDNVARGFFAHENTAIRLLKKARTEGKIKQTGCFIIIGIIFILLLASILKGCGQH